ncbi:DUF6694 family lipoprotein [Alteromonas halophila]|uniref:Lipoprotein n=1 Tax=Alteromonas halophila TaxID=516698 RepID=A0A918JGE9_9ALTE|nr:DUF6694 family lipoprotein [Alteromonas halophila]GGW74879.1 hypothetical protein GCM10007391_03790 [Alteromonas halophila]
MKTLFLVLTLLLTIGCTSVPDTFVFNGDSRQSIQNDIKYILKKLPRSEKQEFVVALVAIQFSDVNSVYDMVGDPAMSGINFDILSKKLDGLTYAEVLELASASKNKVKIYKN